MAETVDRQVGAVVGGAALGFAVHAGINWAKFGSPTKLPGQLQLLSINDPARAAWFSGNGDSFFSLRFLPTTVVHYLRPDTVRFERRAEMRRLAGASLQDEVMGSVIVYNNVTEVYTVESAPAAAGAPSAAPGGRVRAILAPRNAASNPQPAAAAQPAATPLRPAEKLAPAPAAR